jgi:amidohydrolase
VPPTDATPSELSARRVSRRRDDWRLEVDRLVGEHAAELVAFRRRLHAHPELSGQETRTTEAVAERLRVQGLSPVVLVAGTGLVCDVTTAAGPVVALRADIDALAMDDRTESDYRSRVPGVAHACGHDAHTAIVLGAGIVLQRLLPHSGLAGTVRLVFEPAEESVPGGAVDVIGEGFFDGVGSVFGVHCDPKLEAGRVGLRAGAITSATDSLTLVLTGPGGHTARPHLTVDLVAEAARVALELPRALDHVAREHGRASLVWGALRTGDAPNVIPSYATLTGTLRTPDQSLWEQAPELVEKAVVEVMHGSGAEWELRHERGVPPVVNEPAATELLQGVAVGLLGTDGVVTTEQSLGGDSFAWYLQRVPGSYARLGVRDPESDRPPYDLHASTFDIDERAIVHGARLLALAALVALDEAGA